MDTSMLPFGKGPPKKKRKGKAQIKPFILQDSTGIVEPIPLPEPLYQCYITGTTRDLHKHHIFGGANRSKSEKYRLYVYLTAEYHNMSDKGVHFDKELDLRLKREFQRNFEVLNGHMAFMKLIGKNYLSEVSEVANINNQRRIACNE